MSGSSFDRRQVYVCPGDVFVRNPGIVYGSDQKKPAEASGTLGPVGQSGSRPKKFMEWQYAQWAMLAHYGSWFMLKYGPGAFVLSELEYVPLLTGVLQADELLKAMAEEFRKDYSQGGRLRPDILGFFAGPRMDHGWGVTLEILEVTTFKEWRNTLKQDVLYRIGKLNEIIESKHFQIGRTLCMSSSFHINVGPSKWKPEMYWQKVVPLPIRTENGKKYVEWICFQPTFVAKDEGPIDGLLLYHIHSVPLEQAKSPQYEYVLKRVIERERQERQRQQVAYGVTLTPWLTSRYLDQNTLDRDQLNFLMLAVGIGAFAFLATAAAPVVAGMSVPEMVELTAATAARTGGLRLVQASTVISSARLLQSIMETSAQWINVLRGPVAR